VAGGVVAARIVVEQRLVVQAAFELRGTAGMDRTASRQLAQ
jgi:hypothetical protein